MLSRRDEGIIKAVNFYRYMTAVDIAHLLFSPSSLAYVRKQLTALAGGRIISRTNTSTASDFQKHKRAMLSEYLA